MSNWYPPQVTHVIGLGANSLIGYIDESTVLKYPHTQPTTPTQDNDLDRIVRAEQQKSLDVEAQILAVLGNHPRIIRLKGIHQHGLLLEYMPNGSISNYLLEKCFEISLKQKLKWASQMAEAVAYIHAKNVLHCDINPKNMLLNTQLDVKLCDFQGRLLYPDGTINLDGRSSEDPQFSMPRFNINESNQKTDMFALGCSIYFIIEGQLPFPELDIYRDEEEINKRWKNHLYPDISESVTREILEKCWDGSYECAGHIVRDLKALCNKREISYQGSHETLDLGKVTNT